MLNERTITQLSAKNNEPEWFLRNRLDAFRKFNDMKLPVFKYGIGIFLNTKDLDINSTNPIEENTLKALCRTGNAKIMRFSDAFKNHGDMIKKYFMSTVSEENKLIEFHKAFIGKGLLIEIPKDSSAEISIEFLLNSSTSIDHVLIVAGENSKAVIVENSGSDRNEKEMGYRSQIVEIIAKEGAKIEYISVQNMDKNVYNFTRRKNASERDSYVYWLDCCLGSMFTQSITTSMLNNSGAVSKNLGLYLGDEEQKFDLHVETIHNSGNTSCDMLTKGVLNDNAKNVYRGLIRIQPLASNCKAYQHSETLLLSENTETDPVPILEINNNDVKCGHGSAVGQIDKEKIFYMMSRGLTEEQAIETVIKGFFGPVIDQLDPELGKELRDSIEKRVEKGIGKKKMGVEVK